MKFGVKFTISFLSLQFDWQLGIEIAKFMVNFGNLKWTLETVFVKSFVKHTVRKSLHTSNFNIPQTLPKETKNVASQTARQASSIVEDDLLGRVFCNRSQTRINIIRESNSSQILNWEEEIRCREISVTSN